jgi:O-antigen ligase
MQSVMWSTVASHLVLLVVGLPLALRWPVPFLACALMSLAVRFEILLGGGDVGYTWTIQHTLALAALVGMAVRNGIRRPIDWPVAALALVLLLNLAFATLHPRLTVAFMVASFGVLALPFCFTQVAITPGSRTRLALTIASIPTASFLLGLVLDLTGVRDQDHVWALLGGILEPLGLADGVIMRRLEGATGNAGTFAVLCFGGLVAAAGEWLRTGSRRFAILLLLNGMLVVLSGTRAAMMACAVFTLVLVVGSARVRTHLRANRSMTIALLLGLGAALLLYLPQLLLRGFGGGEIALSARDEIWSFYIEEFWFSPLFGRGIGAGFIAIGDWSDVQLTTPHNDYLNLLVSGGIVGFALTGAAIVGWFRSLRRHLRPEDHALLAAAGAAAACFALTWDVLVIATGLAFFAYLGVLQVKPIKVVLRREGASSPATAAADRRRSGAGPATRSVSRPLLAGARPGPGGTEAPEVPANDRSPLARARWTSRGSGKAGARS